MTEIRVENLRKNLADTINRVVYRGEPILITRRDRPVVAMVSLADFERLAERSQVAEACRRRDELKAGKAKSIPWAKAKKVLAAKRARHTK